jgi:hypothetical protein
MRHADGDFGRRLLTRKTGSGGGLFWIALGALLVVVGVHFLHEAKSVVPWKDLLSRGDRAWWVIGGLGLASSGLGARRFSLGSGDHFYEGGACHDRGGRRASLDYSDVESVTYAVRTAGGRLERTLEFAGPGGEPRFTLRTHLDDGDAGDGKAPTAADVQNVASRVARAVAARMVEWVDRSAAVRWTSHLKLTPDGLRVGNDAGGDAAVDVVPWSAIDGVKDGSRSGKIEVYAFGRSEPVATALTRDVNALPGYHAFMRLLERAQTARAA